MVNIEFTYRSCLPIQECIDQLMQPPLHFKIGFIYARDYLVERESDTQLIITFTSGYNLQDHQTKYLATFYEHDRYTFVVMKFLSEKGGFPFPFVTDYEITRLLEKRIDATLIR